MPTLLTDGYVVTMDARRTIHEPGFVLADDTGKIAAVGPLSACPEVAGAARFDLRGHIVVPGLIDLYHRPWTQLFPGGAPAEAAGAALSVEDHQRAASLAGAALVAGGVTTVVATLPVGASDKAGPVREAMAASGLRVVMAVSDPAAAEAGDLVLVETDLLARREGRATEATIWAACRAARERGLKVLSRLWPDGATEAQMLAARAAIGRSTAQHLMEMSALDDGWIVVSPLGLDDMGRMLVKESGGAVVGLPVAEAASGTGTTDLSALARLGVTCGLGTDGPGRSFTTDMIEQMKYAIMSQNSLALDVLSMSAERALEMATVNAARALGRDSMVGAIAPGLAADIAAFDMRGYHFGVHAKPISGLITCAKPSDAALVLCAGRVVHERARASAAARRPGLARA
ncbi:Cytosine/adenosine deaminase [Devosia enhydra]|uniref:Cytosine/adenosine deaminase n=1 Tax=Devosia enhydra TaxID=665118 RepID=A0A1K2HTM8_9HYPH|nr:amidohydrolase family protein [Devosia enhydra]SFZ81549.1 Cytosine/adenosine deaminase [Devosia enhydra]